MGSSLNSLVFLFLRLIDVYLTTYDRRLFFSYGYYVSQGLILDFGSIRSSISSVGSALDCRAGGCGFVSRDRGPILRVLKELRNECSVFALLTSKSSRGSVDHVKIGGHCRLPN